MLTTQHPTKREEIMHMLYIEVLENTLLKWFNDNSTKANPCKYHFLLSGNDSSKITVGNETISSSKCKKLLGIKSDNLCVKKQIKKIMLCLDLHHQ